MNSNSQQAKKRIVIVSEFFYPNKTGSSKVLTELAEDLTSYGMDVEVVTSRNIYNEEMQRLSKFEEYQGVKIVRVWTSKFNKDSSIGRIINYLFFSLSVFMKLISKKKSDHILFVSNPPTVPAVGYFLNLIKGQRYSYLIHDLYPDIAVAMGVVRKSSLFVKMFDVINNLIFRRVEKVIVLGQDMKQRILDKGVPESKISIITNWADKDKIKPIGKKNRFSIKENLQDKFVILYTGNMGKFHQLEILIDAAKSLESYQDIVFVFVGEGYKKGILQDMVQKMNLTNVKFFSYQPDHLYQEVLATGDILVTSLEKGVEGTAVPSKTYSYMAAGKPLLGLMSKQSEIGSLIVENQLGICIVDFDQKEVLVDFLEKVNNNKDILSKFEKNVKILFESNYERKKVTKQFYNVLI